MAEIREVIYWFCTHYPFKHELSRSRLMSMVYLADWRSALKRGTQMTAAEWAFGRFGPYSEAVYETIENDGLFRVVEERNVHGTAKGRVELTGEIETPTIGNPEEAILRYVTELTSPQRWSEMLGLVYSTYPMLVAKDRRFEPLDLPTLVSEYRESQETLS